MRFTVWAFYAGENKPRLVGAADTLDDAEHTAEHVFDEEGAAVVTVHDGELDQAVLALHENREQTLAILAACRGEGQA